LTTVPRPKETIGKKMKLNYSVHSSTLTVQAPVIRNQVLL